MEIERAGGYVRRPQKGPGRRLMDSQGVSTYWGDVRHHESAGAMTSPEPWLDGSTGLY